MGSRRVRHYWVTKHTLLPHPNTVVPPPVSFPVLSEEVKLLSRVRLFATPWTVYNKYILERMNDVNKTNLHITFSTEIMP